MRQSLQSEIKNTITLRQYIEMLHNVGYFVIPDYQRGYIWGQYNPNHASKEGQDSVSYLVGSILKGNKENKKDVFLQGKTAHNKKFDEGCLNAVFRVYQMDYPNYHFHDTLKASRRKLPHLENHQLQTVATACGFQLENHHHALADAETCAWIAREIL